MSHTETRTLNPSSRGTSVFQYGDVAQLVRAGDSYSQGQWFESTLHHQTMGSNAAGMVRRLALKTRFSVMGMGFDSSAARQFLGS